MYSMPFNEDSPYLNFRLFVHSNKDRIGFKMDDLLDAASPENRYRKANSNLRYPDKLNNISEVSRKPNIRTRNHSSSSSGSSVPPFSPPRKDRSFSSSHFDRVTLLTLPRVELWCRDGVCYPYYKSSSGKKLEKKDKIGRKNSSKTSRHSKIYKMPTTVTANMKNNEQMDPAIQKSVEQPLGLRTRNDINIPINTNNVKNTSEIYKHRIRVKNPASSSSERVSVQTNAKASPSKTSLTSRSTNKHPPEIKAGQVTLTIGNYLQDYEHRNNNYSTASMDSSTSSSGTSDVRSASSTAASSIDLDDYSHPKDHSNVQLNRVPSNYYERNITRCSLGPVTNNTTSIMTINNDVSDVTDKIHNDGQCNVSLSSPSNSSRMEIATISSGSNITTGKNDNNLSFPHPVHVMANSNPYCPSCNGIVPLDHHDVDPELPHQTTTKVEPGFWNATNNFHSTLHREASFHSCGGFTLNGQPGHIKPKRGKMSRICSSHKVAFVVSTFSLIVTIGLIITLLLMKKKGMMEAMR